MHIRYPDLTEEEKRYVLRHFEELALAMQKVFKKQLIPAKDFLEAMDVELPDDTLRVMECYAVYVFTEYVRGNLEQSPPEKIRQILDSRN